MIVIIVKDTILQTILRVKKIRNLLMVYIILVVIQTLDKIVVLKVQVLVANLLLIQLNLMKIINLVYSLGRESISKLFKIIHKKI